MPANLPVCILLVDQEEGFLRLLKIMLESRGYKVLHAIEWKTALSLVATADLALVAMALPEIDGPETISLRLQFKTDLKVLACGTYTDERLAGDLRRLGIETFLQKPFPVASLVKHIEQHRAAA